MQLDLTTFILEAINFLVLVWLLKHLFFKPVKKIIERRQAEVAKILSDAKNLEESAVFAQTRLDEQKRAWVQGADLRRQQLEGEIETERAKRLAALEVELASLKVASQAKAQRELEDALGRIEVEAVKQAGQFSARLFTRLACRELEQRLIQAFVDDLPQIPAEQLPHLNTKRDTLTVTTAFQVNTEEQKRLKGILTKVFGDQREINFKENSDLIAGISISIGGNRFDANLKRELKFFTDLGHYEHLN